MPKIRALPDDLQRVAIEELNEVPERIDADLEALRTWIAQQTYLRSRTDDQFLVAFLRGCKYSLEKAKSKLEKYYTLRTRYPDFYTISNVDDPKVIELIQNGLGFPLPTPLHDNGPRIMYVRTGCYDAKKFNFYDVMGVSNGLNAMTLINDDYAMVNGVVTILDFAEYSAAHMIQMTPVVAKKMSTFVEEAMPMRERAMHMINTNAGFETLFNIMKPLMPIKMQERMHVHKNLESLYAHVPQKYLPKHLGGENSSIEACRLGLIKQYEHEFKPYLREESNYGTIENLRPADRSINYDAIFGVDGSFRKLNVD